MKRILSLFVALLVSTTWVLAQQFTVTGVVTDGTAPVAGATVTVQGTTVGTLTDTNGRYSINVPGPDAVLVFSYVSFTPTTVGVDGRSAVDVTLKNHILDEVVVTALGITKEKKKLGYSVQEVVAPDLAKIPASNVAANLTGKVAGLRISNSPDLFSAPAIALRGAAPVIIVNGSPVESANFYEIAPEDIESINVLKGPAAAVLYGQMGRYGVIQVQTKKARDPMKVTFSNSIGFNVGLAAAPEYQSKYGTGYQGQYRLGNTTDEFWGAWGPELDGRLLPQWNSPMDEDGNAIAIPWIPRGKDNLTNFLETGYTSNTNVSFETKGEKGDFRASFSYMYQKGDVPNTKLRSYTANVGGGVNLSKKVRLDANLNYSKLISPNYPSMGYGRSSPIYTMILWTGTNVDVRNLRDYWAPGMAGLQQRNYDVGPGYQYGSFDYNNPYFVLFENTRGYNKDVVFGTVSAVWDILPGLDFTFRQGVNSNSLHQSYRTAVSTAYTRDGNYSESYSYDIQSMTDVMLKYDKSLGDFDIGAMVGGNFRYWTDNYMSASTDGLAVPGVYNLSNTINPTTPSSRKRELEERAVYGYIDVSWKNYIILNATMRNQWSSTLPTWGKNSYLYPSVQLATIVSEYIPMPKQISYIKLRAAMAKVGSAFSPYYFTPTYSQGTTWNDNLSLYSPGTAYADIEPSFSTGYEFGSELRFFNNRLGFDVTYFRFEDGPLTYTQPISTSSGMTGVVKNGLTWLRRGWEVVINGSPFKNPNGFSWDIMVNASRYREILHKLAPGEEKYGNLRIGDRKDKIFGTAIMRAPENSEYAGQIIVNNSGLVQNSNGYTQIPQHLGHTNSDVELSLLNTMSFKHFVMSINFDAIIGGKILSQYEKYMYAGGKSLKIDDTERANWYNGGTYVAQGVKVISGSLETNVDGIISDTRIFAPNDIETNYFDYVQRLYGYYGIDEAVKIDRSFMKLREVSLTYDFGWLLKNNKVLRGATVSVVGRNLFLITKSGLIDPDAYGPLHGSNWDNLQTPSFRNIGFNVSLTF